MRLVYDVDELLQRYRERPCSSPGTLIRLSGIQGVDGYNPSNPVPNGSKPYAYVRVEPRQDEFDSWSVPFRQVAVDCWELQEDLPMLRLQDPFAAVIHGALVVGGVRILAREGEDVFFETVFLRGTSPADLVEFTRGPRNMKDIRLVEIDGGRVGVFTRPQGKKGGRGRIGYVELDSLDDLKPVNVSRATLLDTQPVASQWWGPNAVYRLDSRTLGVLGHMAKYEGDFKHYYPIVFVFDREARTIVQGPEIIADRACFPPAPAKRPDLQDVIFPAWIDRELGLFYGGLSDSTIGVMSMEDPFSAWGETA